MKITQRYPAGNLADKPSSMQRAARVGMAAPAVVLALAFAVYIVLALTRMTQTLEAVRGDIAKTNQQLAETNDRLATMAALLGTTEFRIQATNNHLNGALSATNAQLRSTNRTLREMEDEIGVMARKIAHAKLLF
jgi:septal ring factor EnvC (AmiA/AmiB activator)